MQHQLANSKLLVSCGMGQNRLPVDNADWIRVWVADDAHQSMWSEPIVSLPCTVKAVILQDCHRLYVRALVIQLVVFIAYAVRIPRFKPSTRAIVQRILDMGLHAAAPGVPAIMIFCTIAARLWLQPTGVEELAGGVLKICGETEVVAFDKSGTLTGSLVSMHVRVVVRQCLLEWACTLDCPLPPMVPSHALTPALPCPALNDL